MALTDLIPVLTDVQRLGQANRVASLQGVGLPDGTLRPTCLVRVVVRLEDFTNDDGPNATPGGLPYPNPRAKQKHREKHSGAAVAKRRAAGQPDLADEADARRVAAGRATSAGSGGAQVGAAPENVARDEMSVPLYVVPISGEVEMKGFRDADRAQFSYPLRDLPLYPELVRGQLVEVFMGTVPARDFGDPTKWVPDPAQQFPMFRGFASDVEMSADEQTVQIQAFSLIQPLMDIEIDPLSKSRRLLGPEEGVVSFLKRFLSTIPQYSGAIGGIPINVRVWPNFDPRDEPMLNKKLLNRTLQTAQSRNQAAGGQVAGGAVPPGTDPSGTPGTGNPAVPATSAGAARMKAWDLVTRAAELVGLIPIYNPQLDPNAILLVPAQNLMETPRDGITMPAGGDRESPPFRRDLGIGGQHVNAQVRLFIWGRNLKSLKFNRKFAHQKPRAVRVISFNPDARGKDKILIAQFPETLRGVSASPVGTEKRGAFGRGHRPHEEIVTRLVPPVRDLETLRNIAVSYYHAMSRRELSASLETRDMASFIDPAYPESQNDNPDLLRLRPGTPVRVMIARQQTDPNKPGVVVDTLAEVFAKRYDPAFLRRMLSENWDRVGKLNGNVADLDEVLKKVEAAYAAAKFTDFFYVKAVVHRFSSESGGGYSCRLEVANYVEARNDPSKLGKKDREVNDRRKREKPGRKLDPNDIARQQNQESLIDRVIREGL